MQRLFEVLPFLMWPLLVCISMGLLHGYAGLHVLRRGVIFVDLALAQIAALGTVFGMVFFAHPDHTVYAHKPAFATTQRHSAEDELDAAIPQQDSESGAHDEAEEGSPHLLEFWPTVFALGGAIVLAFGRVPGEKVPHEAIIGIVYVVAAATTILILSNAPHGHEQMEQMLTGKLLFVDGTEVITTAVMYAALGFLHFMFRKPFIAISCDSRAAENSGMHVRLYDCLFYAMFALMVTRSVAVAGVLVVFSFLIIPGACASMLVQGFKERVIWSWIIATTVSLCGVIISAVKNWPTGPTMVVTFGAALVLSILIGTTLRRNNVVTNEMADH